MNTCLWTSVILMLGTCAGSLSAQATIYMSIKVGSTAVLPCDWKEKTLTQLSSPHVEWRTFAETVFERQGGEMYQGEGYEDRVDVPEDKLLKGNCSLVLKNVRPADEGVYESFLLVRRTKRSLISRRVLIQSVELSVDDAPEEINRENEVSERGIQKRIMPNEYSPRDAGMTHTCSQTFMFFLVANILFHIV